MKAQLFKKQKKSKDNHFLRKKKIMISFYDYEEDEDDEKNLSFFKPSLGQEYAGLFSPKEIIKETEKDPNEYLK